MAEAERYADIICANAPLAVQATKRAVVRLMSLPMEQAFYEEPLHAAEVLASEDAREGPRAFAEKGHRSFVVIKGRAGRLHRYVYRYLSRHTTDRVRDRSRCAKGLRGSAKPGKG